MVSSSDIAVQVQSSSLKQDAAEAAFRARYNFGSSEAFKQIFEDIKKTSTVVAPTKDAAPEPVKSDAAVKTTERHLVSSKDSDHQSSVHHDDDKDDKKDTSTQAASTKPADKHTHVKKSKSKSVDADNNHDAGKDDKSADTSSAATSTVTDTQTATATDPTAKATDTATADANPTDGATQTAAQTGTQAVPDKVADATETDGKTTAATPTVVTNPSNLAPLLVANLQSDIKNVADVKSAVGVAADTDLKSAGAEKSAPAGKKAATDPLAAAANDQDADDAFSAALDAQLGQGKDTKIEALKENTKSERDATKAANEKHADHLEFLQGNAAAPKTPPAAGDRAISAALTASDSPAPTPNGSAGGGSPITKGAITGAAAAGLQGLQAMQGDQVTFAGTVRSTKEAQASLMSPNEQVAVHLNRMAKSGTSQYDLQLHPADLGRVDIRLEIAKDGTVQATITADNQQTFDMLQKDSRSLERALQQAGLQADSGSLSFNLRGDQGNGAQQQTQQNNNGSPWNKWMEKTLPDEVAQSKVLAFDVSSGNGRVDIRL